MMTTGMNIMIIGTIMTENFLPVQSLAAAAASTIYHNGKLHNRISLRCYDSVS